MDEDPSNWLQQLGGLGVNASKHIGMRAALVIGVIIFLIVVSIDSAANFAAAADFSAPQPPRQESVDLAHQVQVATANPSVVRPQPSYVDFTPQQAQRLSQGELLTARMTRSQLTRAHFFTDFLGE